MELEEMTRQIGAQGGVMKQLSVFMANGETRAIEALEYTLEAFIKSENWHDFEGEAIEALVKFMGERLSREDVDKRVVARFGLWVGDRGETPFGGSLNSAARIND